MTGERRIRRKKKFLQIAFFDKLKGGTGLPKRGGKTFSVQGKKKKKVYTGRLGSAGRWRERGARFGRRRKKENPRTQGVKGGESCCQNKKKNKTPWGGKKLGDAKSCEEEWAKRLFCGLRW